MNVLSRVLLPPASPIRSPEAARAAVAGPGSTVALAMLAGAAADRLGYAFAAGYSAALRALVPGVEGAAALCATEAGGAHPAAITTTLRDGRIYGQKRWATLAGGADRLLVLLSTGVHDGRSQLRVAVVRADSPGVTLHAMPATPFTPEIPHFSLDLDGVAPESILDGDGWTAFVRPFRTVEDLHVGAAAVGHLLGVGRGIWSAERVTELSGIAAAFLGLAGADPDDPGVQIATQGALDALGRVALPWVDVDPAVAERWQRDAPLLQIAGRARAARLQKALGALGLAPGA